MSRALCQPGPGRPPGAGHRAGPWLCQVGRAIVLPLVPMLPWASHCVPATPSCHIIGDNWWAWVSMVHQARGSQPESLCGPCDWTHRTDTAPHLIPVNPLLSCEGDTAACFFGAAFSGWGLPRPVTPPPAGVGRKPNMMHVGDSRAPLLLGRTLWGAIYRPSFPEPDSRCPSFHLSLAGFS